MSLYTINKDIKIGAERSVVNYLRAGIHENVEFLDATVGKTTNGNTFLSLIFGKGVSKVQFTDYPRIADKPIETMSPEEKKTYEDSIENQMSVLAQFVLAITGEIKNIAGNSFEEIANSLVKILTPHKGKLVRIKVVYDNKGYAIVPRTWWTTVVESMDIPEVNKTIEILDSDKMIRPEKDIEKKEDNPLEDSTTNKDDLPF